ncbi:MAG TPA: sugar ABC transporter permease, partial [Anaerolineae bacterium]|nr:sugar ABC transporter permease [Anaerolineae bacterium]
MPGFFTKQGGRARSLGKRIIRYRMAYVFLLPALIHYAVFGLYPMISGLRLAFFQWDGLSPDMQFVGLDNLIAAFQDARLWNAVSHNVGIAAISVSGRILVGLGLALLVRNIWIRVQNVTTTLVFIPQMI